MHYKCQKVNFKQGGSYIYSPAWLKSKKATKKPQIEDNKCFQYAATVALNYQDIK